MLSSNQILFFFFGGGCRKTLLTVNKYKRKTQMYSINFKNIVDFYFLICKNKTNAYKTANYH